MNRSIFYACVIVSILITVGILMMIDRPEPVRQSPLPQVAAVEPPGPVAVQQPMQAKKPDRKRCIFVEHGIGSGCRYDDAFLAKVGRDGVKAYGWPEVDRSDNVGN